MSTVKRLKTNPELTFKESVTKILLYWKLVINITYYSYSCVLYNNSKNPRLGSHISLIASRTNIF